MATKVVFFVALAALYLTARASILRHVLDEELCFCGSSDNQKVADVKKNLAGLHQALTEKKNFKDYGILRKCSECPDYKALLGMMVPPEEVENYEEYDAQENNNDDTNNERRLLMW